MGNCLFLRARGWAIDRQVNCLFLRGELSLSACPGVGNRPPSEKKIANPRGYARGGMVTGRIEPCIMIFRHV